MSENKNAKTPADGPAANRAMTLEEAQQWITTTWLRCQDEVWRQLPTKHISRETMSTEPEALRLADALDDEFVQGRISNHNGRKAAVELRRLHEVNQDLLKALHEALETEQEPVAWRYKYPDGVWRFSNGERVNGSDPIKSQPLYTAPPKREWVGLTDDDVSYFRYQATFCDEFDAAFMAELIEQALKEKNNG